MTTEVTIRNDKGHNIKVITYDVDDIAGVEINSSEYYLSPSDQVQLHVWKNHSIRIEEGEAK